MRRAHMAGRPYSLFKGDECWYQGYHGLADWGCFGSGCPRWDRPIMYSIRFRIFDTFNLD